MHNFIKALGYLLAIFCLVFGILPPAVYGMFHTGTAVLLVFGGLLFLLCFVWDLPQRHNARQINRRLHKASERRRTPPFHRWKITRSVVAVGFSLCVLGAGALSAWMLSAVWEPPAQTPHTVVVLGCQVIGQEPTRMLKNRLDAAQAELERYPEAPVVVSGGQNKQEEFSEAQVMKQELIKRGIAQERIYLEDGSANTDENLRLSVQVIQENDLPANIAIATDGFHQLRASIYAKQNGLTASPLNAKTPWAVLPSYWVREFFGLAKALIF